MSHFLKSTVAAIAIAVAIITPLSGAARTLDAETSQNFMGEEFDWLLSEGLSGIRPKASDPEALEFVASLFRTNDPRATKGLQGYITRFPRDPAVFDLAGTDLMRQKKYQTAAISFRRAVELDPEAHWTRAKLGTSLILDNKVEDGLDELRKVIEEDPENPLALRYLAWDALNHGNLPQAIIYSERALNAFGLPVGQINQAQFDLANLYSEAGRHGDIVALFGAAVNNDDLSAPSRVQVELFGRFFEAALEWGETEPAEKALDRLAVLMGDAVEVRLLRARLRIQQERSREAIALIEGIRKDQPGMAADLVPDLAIAEATSGDVDAAVSRLGSLADTRGAGADLPLVRMALTMLLDADQGEKAYDFIDARSGAAPERSELALLAAEARVMNEDTDTALELASALTQRAPDDARGHFLLGTVLFQLGDKVGAEASIRRTLELSPQDPAAWMTLLGVVHGHDTYGHGDSAGGHGDIEALLNEAIAANPDSTLLRNELGLMHLSDGQLEKAIAAFDAALKRAPGNTSALTLGALARADLGSDLDTAKILVSLAKQMAPDNVITQDVEGWVAFARGEYDEARKLLAAALELEPSDETTRYHNAMMALHDGKPEVAQKELMLALTGDLYSHYDTKARETLGQLDPRDELVLPVREIGPDGAGAVLGTLIVSKSAEGVEFRADINGLPIGPNSAHVHQRPSCAPKDGVVGGAAGPHFGHDHAGMTHLMPDGTVMAGVDHAAALKAKASGDEAATLAVDVAAMKPRGDLEPFIFDADNYSDTVLTAPQLEFAEIRGRSLMIHQGLDKDGKSGAKLACVVIP